MAVTAEIPATFSTKLETVLHERGMGARTLARLLVDENGGDLDHTRRTIIRWLRGSTPVDENRWRVEDALGLSRDDLKGVTPPSTELVEKVRKATDSLVDVLVAAVMDKIESGRVAQ